MATKGLIHRFILPLFFVAAIISAASIERMNNSSTLGNMVCATRSNVTCTYGGCEGGACSPCEFNPLLCCISVIGNCIAPGGTPYGICNPVCDW